MDRIRSVGFLRGVAALVAGSMRGRRRAGTAAMLLVVTLAALGIAAGLGVRAQGAAVLDEVATHANVADLVLFGDEHTLTGIGTSDPSVAAATGPMATTGAELLRADGSTVTTRLMALDRPDGDVGRPAARTGTWPDAGADEVVLDRSLARELGLRTGDDVQLRRGSVVVTARVVGTAIDLTDCSYPQCSARAYASAHVVQTLGIGAHMTLLRLVAGTDPDAVVTRLLASQPGVAGSDSWPDTRADFLAVDGVFGAFLAAFGLFLLVAACIVVAGTTVARLAARRRELGLLKATGATPGQLALALVVEQLLVGLAGAVIGWTVAGLLAPAWSIGIGPVFGTDGVRFAPGDLAVVVLVIAAILTLTTLLPAWRAARTPATDAIRGVGAQRASRTAAAVERAGASPGVVLAAGDASARPVRSVLAAAGVVLAVIGAVVAIGMVGTIDDAIDHPARTGSPADISVESTSDAGQSGHVGALVRSTEGVEVSWGFAERRSIVDGHAFRSVAVDAPLSTLPFVIGGGRAPQHDDEALAGYGFLDQYGLHVGDRIHVDAGGTPLDLTITGWYRTSVDTGRVLLYPLAALTSVDPTAVADHWQAVVRPGSADAVAATLRAAIGSQARVRVERSTTDLTPVRAALGLVAALVALVAGVHLLMTHLTGVRERAREIGVVRALGATDGFVLRTHALSAGSLGLLGSAIGVPLGIVVLRALSDPLTSGLGLGPGFVIGPSAAVYWLVPIGAVLAGLLGAVAAMTVLRRPTSTLVRWE